MAITIPFSQANWPGRMDLLKSVSTRHRFNSKMVTTLFGGSFFVCFIFIFLCVRFNSEQLWELPIPQRLTDNFTV